MKMAIMISEVMIGLRMKISAVFIAFYPWDMKSTFGWCSMLFMTSEAMEGNVLDGISSQLAVISCALVALAAKNSQAYSAAGYEVRQIFQRLILSTGKVYGGSPTRTMAFCTSSRV
jgi:hypothetical protein